MFASARLHPDADTYQPCRARRIEYEQHAALGPPANVQRFSRRKAAARSCSQRARGFERRCTEATRNTGSTVPKRTNTAARAVVTLSCSYHARVETFMRQKQIAGEVDAVNDLADVAPPPPPPPFQNSEAPTLHHRRQKPSSERVIAREKSGPPASPSTPTKPKNSVCRRRLCCARLLLRAKRFIAPPSSALRGARTGTSSCILLCD